MKNSISAKVGSLLLGVISSLSVATAASISINFHAEDADNPADHQLTTGESGGLDGNGVWNNINLGLGGQTATAGTIFPSTVLTDDTGNTSAGTIAPSGDSSFFTGYSASNATTRSELGLAGNGDDLFNSYLALNGPNGDGSPADAAVLVVSGLSSVYTTNGYQIILYSDSDKGPVGGNRQSVFTVTPSGAAAITVFTEDDSSTPTGSTFANSFIESDGVDDGADYSNYVVIDGLSASGFTLEITSPDGGRGALNGLQIVAIPEPTTAFLFGAAAFGFLLRRRG